MNRQTEGENPELFTTRPRERTFADTGWFAMPLEVFDANLTPYGTVVYAILCMESDKGNDPPELMQMALIGNMTNEQAQAGLDELVSRGMLKIKGETDWLLTEPETWKKP